MHYFVFATTLIPALHKHVPNNSPYGGSMSKIYLFFTLIALSFAMVSCAGKAVVPDAGLTLKGEIGKGLEMGDDRGTLTVETKRNKLVLTIEKNKGTCIGKFKFVGYPGGLTSMMANLQGGTLAALYEGSFSQVEEGCKSYVEGEGNEKRAAQLMDVRNLKLSKGISFNICTLEGNCVLPYAAGTAF